MNSSKLVYFASVLVYIIASCEPLPVGPYAERTCKHKKDASGWNTCNRKDSPASYTLAHEGFADDVRNNIFTEAPMHVLSNTMQCFRIRMYSEIPHRKDFNCPSICKLRDSDEEDDPTCEFEEDYLMVPAGRENTRIINMKSPRYPCQLPYRQDEVCLYNVSLSCDTDHVIISSTTSQLSNVSLADEDFLEVLDFTHKRPYPKIKGPDSLKQNFHVHASRFVVLFWSSASEKASQDGFNINLECGVKPTTEQESNIENGSAMEISL